MKILSLGMDKNLADQSSGVSKRVLEYSGLVDKYTVITLADKDGFLDLNSNTRVFLVEQKNKFLAFWKMKKKIKAVLRSDNYDLITVQDPYFIGYLACKLANRFKIGLEVQIHGFEKYRGFRKVISNYVLRRADVIRTVSQRLKKELINNFKIKEEKIVVIPIYVESKLKNQELEEKNSHDEFIFLTIGRLVPVKNIQMQIEAINKLKDKFENIKLWIVGDGLEKEECELKIKNYGLEDKIKLLGYQKDLSSFYQKADVFLLSSDSEGYGMVIIEAANYALPIIMTDVGCAGEFIKDRENGIIIPIKDQKSLEQGMEELIKDSELRKKLGDNAQKSTQGLLSKEETLNLYKESWEKARKK